MKEPNEPAVDHYGSQYSNFRADVVAAVRAEAFGDDYGQNGWQTAGEQDRFIEALSLDGSSRLLDVACGSGGPSLRIAQKVGCSVVGVDLHVDGVAMATSTAAERGLTEKAEFRQADASQPLPFDDESFDGVLCIDAINHLEDRERVLAEFARVLKPGGRLLYTDPIVVTGWLSDAEMRTRSSIGFFLFFPLGCQRRGAGSGGFRGRVRRGPDGEHGPHGESLASGPGRTSVRPEGDRRGGGVRRATDVLRCGGSIGLGTTAFPLRLHRQEAVVTGRFNVSRVWRDPMRGCVDTGPSGAFRSTPRRVLSRE